MLVLGTDGLWDNLFDNEILELLATPSTPEAAAERIAAAAYARSKERRARTPFAVHARQQGYFFPGGKQDDITVLVVQFGDQARL